MILNKVQKKLQRELKILNIGLRDFTLNPPILVFQSGKVGSSTVASSLTQAKLKNPIYHVHRLSEKGINSPGAKPKLGRALRRKIDAHGGISSIDWKIISLTRDPIAIAVSALFQSIGIGRRNDLLQKNGEIDKILVLEELYRNLENFDQSYFCTWFDRELKTVFDVDAFAYPFDHNQGYTIIKQNNVDVLIIRLEDLNNHGSCAIAEFLNLDSPVALKSANVASTKKYADAYRDIKKSISLPVDICQKVYSSKYTSHFYDSAQQEKFIQNWTQKRQINNNALAK